MNVLRLHRTKLLITSAAAVCLAVALVAAAVVLLSGDDEETPPLPAQALGLELVAADGDSLGVGPESAYILKSGVELTEAQVRSAIRVSPEAELDISERSPREFELQPGAALAEDQVYRFTFVDLTTEAVLSSWAFQVRAPLRVVSTLPGNERAQVPLDSGIEVTFSSDGVVKPEDFVEISPALEGHFEQHKRILAFVPRELQPRTLYTVRVKAGVPVQGSSLTLAEEFVFQFETGEERRGGPGPPYLSFARSLSEAPTREAAVIMLATSDAGLRELPVSVYAYPDTDRFLADLAKLDSVPSWSTYARDQQALVDPASLRPVATFTAVIEGQSDPGLPGAPRQPYFRLPEPLPPGFYVLETEYAGAKRQAWLQVTDIAAFVSLSQTTTLVWVNDVASAGPLAGAGVEAAGGGRLGTTDAQGVAEFDTPDDLVVQRQQGDGGFVSQTARGALLVRDASGRLAVVPLSNVYSRRGSSGRYESGASYNHGSEYWTFLSTDRPLYRPTDKVRFWGVARARQGDARRDLTVELMTGAQTARVGSAVAVRTDDFGAYEGEIELTGLPAGYYRLRVLDDAGVVRSTSFEVSQYIKPAYRVSAEPSKLALLDGEAFQVDITAEFFEGTPVSGLELRYSSGKGEEGRVTTGEDGRARLDLTARLSSGSEGIDYQTLSIAPINAEEAEIVSEAPLVVFPGSVYLAGKGTYDGSNIRFEGDASLVDTQAYSEDVDKGAYPFYARPRPGEKPRFLAQPARNAVVTLDITEVTYERREVGESYDFVNKVAQKVYTYSPVRRALPSVTPTSDGAGKFSYAFPATQGASYEVRMSARDAAGRTPSYSAFAYAGTQLVPFFQRAPYLSIEGQEQEVFFASAAYEIGEEAALTFRRGPDPLPAGGGNRYLFYESQLGTRRHTVQDSPVYRFSFQEEHVPSVVVDGVYFNGFTYVQPAAGVSLRFEPAARRLNIDVEAGEESYGPGDEATVRVSVTDDEGRPVRADVNLAAVDEAVFSVQDFANYQQDILGQLYAPVASGVIYTYASHQYPAEFSQPGGRGGDGGPRQDFTDVAFYGSVRTDASGKGEVKFKLPDNLTSWRVTAYAITDPATGSGQALKAGRGAGSVAVSKPFFVEVALNEDYLTDDKPVLRARAFGSELREGEPVKIVVKAPSLAGAPLTAEGKAFEPIEVALPDLKLGEHELTIEASSAGREDAVVRKISVLDSRLLAPRLEYHESLKPGDTLKGASDRQTTVVFSDAGRGRFFPQLQSLHWTYGDRVDQTLARVLAAQLLNQYFGQQLPVEDFPARLYLTMALPPRPPAPGTVLRGAPIGVAILPFAEPDLAITARVAALAPELFGRQTLREHLRFVADNPEETPERVAIALYGLAALGDPVLLELKALAQSPDLGWRGRLYLGLALQAAGDDPSAHRVFDGIVREYGEEMVPFRRLRVGADQDDILEATSLAAILAAGLGDPAAESYFRYMQENHTRDILLELEELSYVKAALARSGSGTLRFSYELDGKREDVELERGASRSLSLSPEQLSRLRIVSVDGSLSASAFYLAPLVDPSAVPSPDIAVRRSFNVLGGGPSADGNVIPVGALVEVILDYEIGPQAPDGCYQIVDHLPSGLKPVTRPAFATGYLPPGVRGTRFPNLVEGQRVTFCVGRSQNMRVTYLARVSGKGAFVWEPAVMNHSRAPSLRALTPAVEVETR
ncbi:MAG: hypothetical protein GEU75_16380 [Dehalococcoidia bacterium]|nr:hypothetical protein [Dehalococcoidia bacterium]